MTTFDFIFKCSRVRTYDSVFGSGEAKADIKRKGGNEEAKILSPAADKKKEEEVES